MRDGAPSTAEVIEPLPAIARGVDAIARMTLHMRSLPADAYTSDSARLSINEIAAKE